MHVSLNRSARCHRFVWPWITIALSSLVARGATPGSLAELLDFPAVPQMKSWTTHQGFGYDRGGGFYCFWEPRPWVWNGAGAGNTPWASAHSHAAQVTELNVTVAPGEKRPLTEFLEPGTVVGLRLRTAHPELLRLHFHWDDAADPAGPSGGRRSVLRGW